MRLAWQIILIMSSLLLVMSLIVGLVSADLYKGSYLKQTNRYSKGLAGMLSHDIAEQVIRDEVLQVSQILKRVRKSEPGITYLYVTDFDGRLIADTFEGGFPRALLHTLERDGAPGSRHHYYQTSFSGIDHFSTPLIPGMSGRLYLGFTNEDYMMTVAAMRRQIITWTLIIAAMGVFISLLIVLRLSRPMERLTHLVSEYARGRAMEAEVFRVKGGAEVRELGKAITDMVHYREELENRLRASEEENRTLLEHAPIGLALADMEGGLLSVNPAYAAMIGRTVDEVMGLEYWDITPGEYKEQEQEQLLSLKSTGRYGPYEKEYLHKDGHRVPVRLSGLLIDRGREQSIWSVVEDITAQKQLEQERLAHLGEQTRIKAKLEEAQRIAQVGNWELDFINNKMEWSKEIYRILNVDPGHLTPSYEGFIATVHPDDRNAVRAEIQRSKPSGAEPYHIKHRVQTGDGRILVVEERGLIERDQQGIPLRMHGTTLDITEQTRIEEELERHRRHLEELVEERTAQIRQQASIIDQTHDSVVTTDLDGIISSWNNGAERMFGMLSDDAVARPISIIFPKEQQTRLKVDIIPRLKADGQYETEVNLLHADRGEFPVHLSLSMLYDELGAPSAMVGYSMDISELKRREALLKKMTERLQTANEELESFSYSVSHDLRSPLRSIDGFSQALEEDYAEQLDEVARDYLARVRNAVQRMGRLIDDMLELSRVGRVELHHEFVDLGHMAQAVIDELSSGEPERKVHLEIEEGMQMRGDARLLRMVLDNLIGNAWKFTAREAESHITLGRLSDRPEVVFISDNGVGFDMLHAGKLFGAFQRLHHARDFPGTGVGLATVARIIHRHGGRIWAESEEGEGATFYFTLGSGEVVTDYPQEGISV